MSEVEFRRMTIRKLLESDPKLAEFDAWLVDEAWRVKQNLEAKRSDTIFAWIVLFGSISFIGIFWSLV